MNLPIICLEKYILDASENSICRLFSVSEWGQTMAHMTATHWSRSISASYPSEWDMPLSQQSETKPMRKHHTQGRIPATRAADRISIKVGEQGASFTVIIHSPGYDKISAGVTSPTGEAVSRVSFQSGLEFSNQLVLENTRITLRYFRDNNNNVIVSFKNATQGIWNIILYGDLIINGEYWAWLPITGQISPTVEFLRPTPEYTIVIPSTALRA